MIDDERLALEFIKIFFENTNDSFTRYDIIDTYNYYLEIIKGDSD